jgi:hypothetical protein
MRCVIPPKPQLADWAIDLVFFRTKVGREFEIAERLRRKDPAGVIFGTYGYFDLVSVTCINDLKAPSLVPIEHDLQECAPFRFFADAESSRPKFQADLEAWRTTVAVFLKLDSHGYKASPFHSRREAAQFLKDRYSNAHVFYALGHSELVMLLGGDDLAKLLGNVTELRNASNKDTSRWFARTTTFPLVSYEAVHKQSNYKILTGLIHPVITVRCTPAAENAIVSSLPSDAQFHARNIYGDTDLTVYWYPEAGVSVGVFAETISILRKRWADSDLVHKTSSYIEIPRLRGESTPCQMVPSNADLIHPQLLPKLDTLFPLSLRASVADLIFRLTACLADPVIALDYADMEQTFPFIEDLLDHLHLATTANPVEAEKHRMSLMETADLARSAINQRYAGLESNPETLSHSQSPVLCEIRSYVLAASAFPGFIFDRLRMDQEPRWAGYILFGGTYSPLQREQNIFSLPTNWLFKPIEEWFKITHEVGHGVFNLLNVEGLLPSWVKDSISNAYGPGSTIRVINEIFANWFDWRYVFNRETNFFVKKMWESLLGWPAVWEKKPQYLVRGFAVFLAGQLSEIQSHLSSGRRSEVYPIMEQKWLSFVELLNTIPDAAGYCDLPRETIHAIIKQIINICPLLFFLETGFETACQIEGLSERLNPEYLDLETHVQELLNGNVVSTKIVNPCRLHLSLLRELNGSPPKLATEIAYIFSMETFVVARNCAKRSLV